MESGSAALHFDEQHRQVARDHERGAQHAQTLRPDPIGHLARVRTHEEGDEGDRPQDQAGIEGPKLEAREQDDGKNEEVNRERREHDREGQRCLGEPGMFLEELEIHQRVLGAPLVFDEPPQEPEACQKPRPHERIPDIALDGNPVEAIEQAEEAQGQPGGAGQVEGDDGLTRTRGLLDEDHRQGHGEDGDGNS